MAEINVLSKEVRELIAASEVVERPASVVKELVENAVDAGATNIEIELKNNGLGLIRVTDNGKGIAAGEVATAFLRHATSKLSVADDLDSIGTLGFRGEALAAICAVSKTRLVTKTSVSNTAFCYRIEAGEEISFEETGAPDGTSVYVSELFYNVPARMKFLKKDVYEGNAVQTVCEQLAMSHPEISFKLMRDGKAAFQTPGDGELYSAVYAVFPRDIAGGMIKILPVSDKIKVSGYISAPEKARASRSLQFFYVNGRFIKSQSAGAAASEACRNLIMQGKYPSFVINIELPQQDVDVNVHPAKTEIRFRNDREVFSAIYAAVKIAVSEYAGSFVKQTGYRAMEQTETNTENPEHAETVPERGSQTVNSDNTEEVARISTLYADDMQHNEEVKSSFAGFVPEIANMDEFLQQTLEQAARAYEQKNRGLDIEYTVPLSRKTELDGEDALHEALKGEKPSGHIIVLGELFDTYIVGQVDDRVIFVDKHAAHERILFEQLTESGSAGIERQILLEPVLVSMPREEKQILLDNAPAIEKIGFLIDEFGENEVAVREIPTYFTDKAVADAVTALAVQLAENSSDITTSQTEWLLHSAACRAAIKAGNRTSRGELVQLVAAILDNEIPKFCPHGRPVYFMLDKKEIEKRFGRIQ